MAKRQKLVDGGDYLIPSFRGLNTATNNPKLLVDGEPQDSLNFITGWDPILKAGDNIQLRTGSALLHKTRLGAGKVNAVAVGQNAQGVQVPFFIAGGNAYYYNSVTGDYSLIGALPATEDMAMQYYKNLWGDYMYISSPNTGMFLIPVANPSSMFTASSTNGSSQSLQGYISIRSAYMFMWNYLNKSTQVINRSILLQSKIDDASITADAISGPGSTGIVGDGTTKTWTGTLGQSALAQGVQIGAPLNTMGLTSFTKISGSSITITYTGGFAFVAGDYVVLQGVDAGYAALNDIIWIVTVGGTATITVVAVNTPASVPASNTFSQGSLSKLEMFFDDQSGNLNSNLGDKGTVNYVTGAITINTNVAIPNTLKAESFYFTGSPSILGFGTGSQSYQQGGGLLSSPGLFNGQIYSFHQLQTWLITDLTNGYQQQYRGTLGAPFFRSIFEKGDGVLFLDNSQQNNPKFRILQISNFNNAVEPDSLSDNLDLSQNAFSYCKVHTVGNYDFLACQSVLSGTAQLYNDTCYLRNNISGFWDKMDFRISDMDVYNGTIIAGDTITNNLLQLFNGVDDDGAPINNHWTSGHMNLGFAGGKTFNFFYIDGYIGPSQVLNIYVAFDNGNFVLLGSIYGNGKYVDPNNQIVVGEGLSGLTPVGAGGNGQLVGYHFQQQIPFNSPIFNYVSVQFSAGQDLVKNVPTFGSCQINSGWGFRDTRIKSQQAQTQYIGH